MPPSRRHPRHGRRQEAVSYWAPSSPVAAASRGDVNERVSTSLVRFVSPPRDLQEQERSTAFTSTNSMHSNSSSSFLPTANSSSIAAPNRTKNSSGVLVPADCRLWGEEGQRFVSFPSSFSETSPLLSMLPLPRSASPSCSYSSPHRIIQILDEVLDILLDQEED